MTAEGNQSIVHVAVYPAWADWEAGYLISRINNPMWQVEPGRFAVRTVAETLEPITTMGGVRILPDLTFDDLRPQDSAMLVLPGADSWDQDPSANQPAVAAARAFLAAGVPVAAICGATAGLARAGLLDDREHTSSAVEYLSYGAGYAGGALYRDEPAVLDRGLITAGPLHPVEFARTALEVLGAFPAPVLDAWYRMFGQHDASAFAALAGQGA
jgi:putative intracellular protease/amidase